MVLAATHPTVLAYTMRWQEVREKLTSMKKFYQFVLILFFRDE